MYYISSIEDGLIRSAVRRSGPFFVVEAKNRWPYPTVKKNRYPTFGYFRKKVTRFNIPQVAGLKLL